MSKYESIEILPLNMVDFFENNYPGCWNMIGFNLADIKSNSVNYGHYRNGLKILFEKYNIWDDLKRLATSLTLLMIAVWRKNKQIFCFDKEILKDFCNQEINFDMSPELFEQLPYPCIYIDVDGISGVEGFWVMKCSDDLGNKSLCINFVVSDAFMSLILLTVNGASTINDIIKNFFDSQREIKMKKKKNIMRERLKLALQCLLYICAANAEIEEDPIQKKRYRAPSSEQFIKDKVREVKKWNCGKKESKIIYSDFGSYPRIVTDMKENHIRNVKSSPKRCHVRRSHWHHYWTGSSKDGTRKMDQCNDNSQRRIRRRISEFKNQ